MGRLYEKMKKDMELKNLSHRTIKTYLACMKGFVLHYGRSPEGLGDKEIKDYLYFLLKERQLRAMRAIEICRTAYLGGHVDECDHCGALRISYNSCRNRHCPKCQSLDKERWLEYRKRELLPTQYFHAVFTLPEGLRSLSLRNQKVIYNIFFRAVSETLQELSKAALSLEVVCRWTGCAGFPANGIFSSM